MENLITITIRSTHYYLIDLKPGFLMVDAGWPGALPALAGQLKRYQLNLDAIRYLIITHHHPDHAGLAQEIKDASNARLIIHEKQVPFLDNLKALYGGKEGYVPVRVEAGDVVLKSPNRGELHALGIRGEVVETPGHSDDSVSLVLESGLTFIGDLHLPTSVPDADRAATLESWARLRRLNARRVYPANGEPLLIEGVRG